MTVLYIADFVAKKLYLFYYNNFSDYDVWFDCGGFQYWQVPPEYVKTSPCGQNESLCYRSE